MRKLLSLNLFLKSALLMCCLVLTGHLMAQTRVISGKVTDANDNPVSNASVVVKGSSVGTTTGPDGIYTLKLPLTAKVLVFSGIGLTKRSMSLVIRKS